MRLSLFEKMYGATSSVNEPTKARTTALGGTLETFPEILPEIVKKCGEAHPLHSIFKNSHNEASCCNVVSTTTFLAFDVLFREVLEYTAFVRLVSSDRSMQ